MTLTRRSLFRWIPGAAVVAALGAKIAAAGRSRRPRSFLWGIPRESLTKYRPYPELRSFIVDNPDDPPPCTQEQFDELMGKLEGMKWHA